MLINTLPKTGKNTRQQTATVANLNEMQDEFKRKLFGIFSEKAFGPSFDDAQETAPEEEQVPETTTVKEHTRTGRKTKGEKREI